MCIRKLACFLFLIKLGFCSNDYAHLEIDVINITATTGFENSVSNECANLLGAKWSNWYLTNIVYTPSEFYQNVSYFPPLNVTTLQAVNNLSLNEPVYVTVFFSLQVVCQSGQTIRYPAGTVCNGPWNFTIPLDLTSNITQTLTICQGTEFTFSYVYYCTRANYYPPTCMQYCTATNNSNNCFTCSTNGTKRCCDNFDGEDCTFVPVTQPTTLQVTTVTTCNASSSLINEDQEHTYYIAMIAMSAVAGLFLIIIIILLIGYCCSLKNRENTIKQTKPTYQIRTMQQTVKPKQPRRVVVERDISVDRDINLVEEPQEIARQSIHSDSSDERNYFDQPWNENVANLGLGNNNNKNAYYSVPHQRGQRSDGRNDYQNNRIIVLDGDPNEDDLNRAGGNQRELRGTYI